MAGSRLGHRVFDSKCAGNRIDAAIADYVKKTFNLSIGDKMSEDIKINIGSAVPLDEELVMVVKGRDFITGLPRTAEVKTNEIVKAIGKELRDMIKAIKDVLQETPPELSADIIDNGITMTGGSSMLRNFPELVYRRTGVKAVLAKDALYCVAKGTGIASNTRHLQEIDYYKAVICANFYTYMSQYLLAHIHLETLHHAYCLHGSNDLARFLFS